MRWPTTLKLGSAGEAVKVLQRGLNKLGSLLLVDGDFGSSTQAADPGFSALQLD